MSLGICRHKGRSDSVASFAGAGAYRRNSVMEITNIRTKAPSKPNSSMEEWKIVLAPSLTHTPCLLRVAASKVITKMRRIEAISPTTRKG